jgi:RNA polymerase sigma factor (sigma-70 family)
MVFNPLPDYGHLLRTLIDRKLIENIARKQTQHTSIPWEDAAQAAYEKLWRRAKEGYFHTGDDEDFYHWATRVSYFTIIDYLRGHYRAEQCYSLDATIPGTDIAWQERLIDDFDLLDACERADRVLSVVEIVTQLDQRYPKRGYLKIWQGLVQDQTQAEIAQELNLDPPEISKRWKKLRQQIATLYLEQETRQHQAQSNHFQLELRHERQRSKINW